MIDSKESIDTQKEELERYQLAISAANIGVWDWIIPTNTLYFSKIWKAQIGYQDHELDNKFTTWVDHLHPEESKLVQQKVADYLKNPEGKYINEFRFRHKNGSYIWILAKSETLKNKQGEVIRLFGSHTDITKRKEVEQRLEAIYKQSSEGITIADTDGNYVFVNPAFCTMSGYNEKELLAMTVFDMKAKNQDHNSFQKTKDSPQIIRVTLQRKNGSEYFTEIIGDVITVQNEQLVLGTIRDITDQVKAENEVKKINENLELLIKERTTELKKTVHELNNEITQREAAETTILEELEVKEILLKEITHRVKNNLQIISSIIRLQLRTIQNPEAADLLNQTSNRIESIALIHEALNTAQNIKEVQFKEYVTSLITYIKSIFDMDTVSINVEIDDLALPLDDATNFGMILMELITNSIKHAFPEKENAEINISMHSIAANKYQLTVHDNGIGLPNGLDFKTTESLGMQIIASLTEQLNATLKLTNKNGTSFEITQLL